MDLERLAAAGADMPDGLKLPEQLLFLTLRELYKNYRSGAVNKDRAKREKSKIMAAYNGLVFEQRVIDHHLAIRERIRKEMGNIYKCGCSDCQRMARILDGIERRDLNEDVVELNELVQKLQQLVGERTDRNVLYANLMDQIKYALGADIPPEQQIERIAEIVTKRP